MQEKNKEGRQGWSFSNWCRGWSRPLLLPVARFFAAYNISPNTVTLIGLFFYALSGLTLALGYRITAGLILALFGPLDAVDGLLAREQGNQSKFGAFLDSTMDRYAEFFLFAGLLVYLWKSGHHGIFGPLMVLTAMTGSLLVSYTRARAEALGFSCTVGMLTRLERLILFAVGLIFNFIMAVLVILAFFTHVTAIQRIWHVYKQASKQAE